MHALVARIGKAHSLKGEVTVQAHTDAPGERFVPGETFATDPPAAGPLTIATSRLHNGVWLLSFEGHADRSAAEALRGVRLLLDTAAEEADDDDEGWYPHELVGLAVHDPSGARIGEVTGLDTRPAQDLLGVRLTDGRHGLVPFVEALVPVVDVAGGRVVIDVPDGLFDLDTH